MTLVNIGRTGLPMRLRRVEVGKDGSLLASHDRTTQHFRFLWRGETFHVRYRHDAEGARVRVAADLARLPYVAEDAERYAALKRIVDAARDHIGPDLHVTRDRRIVIGRRMEVAPPMTADRLMALLAEMLLRLDPYLRLVQEYR